jgi:hypothetical protein
VHDGINSVTYTRRTGSTTIRTRCRGRAYPARTGRSKRRPYVGYAPGGRFHIPGYVTVIKKTVYRVIQRRSCAVQGRRYADEP